MNTEFALLAQYNKAFVTLEEISNDFFNMGEKKAEEIVASGDFPIPVMRGGKSQKSPYLLKVSDLAQYLDKQYLMYKEDWEKMQR